MLSLLSRHHEVAVTRNVSVSCVIKCVKRVSKFGIFFDTILTLTHNNLIN